MPPIVLTNCTARKSAGPAVPALPAAAWSSVNHAASVWWKQVRTVAERAPSEQVYQGRSVQEAKASAQELGGALSFVSVGMGLVDSLATIPRYDLSLAQGPGAIAPRLKPLMATPADWWSCLTRRTGRNLRGAMAAANEASVYLALPSTYLQLLAMELEQLADSGAVERLWIFTAPAGQAQLPPQLRARAMPYDQRLDAIRGGTQADFPQRCLRHFVSLGLAPTSSADAARRAVAKALGSHELPARRKGRAVSDIDALALLRTHWDAQSGQSSKLLRLFRGELGVACEQGRFRTLYHRVRAELGGAS